MEKWHCCGHDIIRLCERAGCKLPERCFFCGQFRETMGSPRKPEDWLAFDLEECWGVKIRELQGDMEAWRAVARRVFDLVDSRPGIVDLPTTRDVLINAIQAYAEEWKTGTSPMHSDGKVNLCIALDRHEFEVANKALLDLEVKRLKRGS
jgi:hypothetical protein